MHLTSLVILATVVSNALKHKLFIYKINELWLLRDVSLFPPTTSTINTYHNIMPQYSDFMLIFTLLPFDVPQTRFTRAGSGA